MTDAQVRTLLPDLLERAAIEDHLADGCNDGSTLQRGHLDWAQSLRDIAAHLEAGLAERELAAQDAERWRSLRALMLEDEWLCSVIESAIDAAREASRDD